MSLVERKRERLHTFLLIFKHNSFLLDESRDTRYRRSLPIVIATAIVQVDLCRQLCVLHLFVLFCYVLFVCFSKFRAVSVAVES
jgi:hypothetical protein